MRRTRNFNKLKVELKTIFTLGRSFTITKNWTILSITALFTVYVKMKWIKYWLATRRHSEKGDCHHPFFNKLRPVYKKFFEYQCARRILSIKRNGFFWCIIMVGPLQIPLKYSLVFFQLWFFLVLLQWGDCILWVMKNKLNAKDIVFVGSLYPLLKDSLKSM